jgi:dihydroorotate dehydrogenase electron transfer subunit
MINRINLPLCLPIENITIEGIKTKTLEFSLPFDLHLKSIPGQYFMLWNPGDDEIPISISKFKDKNLISFTICSEGETSNNLLNKNKLELIGLRGPFGNGFELIEKGTAILVAGGMGIAPLRYLIHTLMKRKSVNLVIIQGARTGKELFYKTELENLAIESYFCTDDGTIGVKGFPTEILNTVLKGFSSTKTLEIYSCGPEIMLKAILNLAMKYSYEANTQFCLADRYIRCGFGICGSCTLDDQGLTICHDGPVFRGSILKNIKDFGTFGRKSNGSKYPI